MDITTIKRKLLIRYPTFGNIIANIEFCATDKINTAATDGKTIFYNITSLDELNENEQFFVFAHEVCHIVFDHIYRSKGKDIEVWNIATDAVINALLKEDGLQVLNDAVNIPEAIKYNADQMYEKLVNQKKDGKKLEWKSGKDSHDMWEKKEKDIDKIENSKNDEQKEFGINKKKRSDNLKKFNKELAKNVSIEGKKDKIGKTLENIGIARELIDWRRLLRYSTRQNEEWTRKNVIMRNGFFRYKLNENPSIESEILLDVSGSVNEELLKNFLRECKNILNTSNVKVGCFDTKFYGFNKLQRMEDIDKMNFSIGGGTDFNIAVNSFSRNATNKIIFTDGESFMPKANGNGVIWVVYGDKKINPKGGKVINIPDEQLKNLSKLKNKEKSKER